MPFHLMLLKANKHGMRDRLQDLHIAMGMMLSSGDHLVACSPITTVVVRPRRGPAHQGLLHLQRHAQALGQVDAAVRRRPLESVQQLREPEVDGGEGHRLAGAHAPAGPERREPEVPAQHAHVLLLEPLGAERRGLRPDGGVVRDGPHVDHGRGARGDEAAADHRVMHGEAGPREQRARRVRAQRLLDDALEVGQAGHVGVRHGGAAAAAHDRVQLRLRLALDVRVQHHPRHHPLQQDGNRVENSDHVGVRQLLLALQTQQDVDEVSGGRRLATIGGGGAPLLPVLFDDPCHEHVHSGHQAPAPPPDALRVQPLEQRQVVGPVEHAEQVVAFLHHLLQLHALGAGGVVARAEDGGHDVVQGGRVEHAPHGDLAAAAAERGDLLQHSLADGGAARGRRGDAARAEKVGGADAAQRAPVVAGGGEAHGAVEQELPRRVLDGAVCEGGAGQQLPRRVRPAGHDEAREADGEGRQRGAAGKRPRHGRERAVRRGAPERGDHARRTGRWRCGSAPGDERPRGAAGGETHQGDGEDEDGQERGE
ncbi:hypothetical protein U9M48_007689 [Paspalum notatum var. saurae]|uniref:Uncharacterized protein n=1 Tax=Paspalum notatum var. saurae TaxID=547442 RepID=A0AAQ3SMT0_PASNO